MSRIRKIFRHTILHNALFLAGTNGLNLGVAFLFAALSSRYLSKADFGRMILVLSLTTFFEAIVRASVSMVLTQRIAQKAENATRYWWPSLLMHLGFGSSFVLSGLAWGWLRGWDPLLMQAVFLASLISTMRLLGESAVGIQRGLDQMGPEFRTTILERALFLALVAGVMRRYPEPSQAHTVGFLALFGVNVLTQSLQAAALIGPLWRKLRPSLHLDRDSFADLYRSSSPIWISGLLMALHWRVGIFYLERFSTGEALGDFGAAYKILEAVRILPWLLCMAIFPRLSREAAHPTGEGFRTAYVFVLKLLLVLAVPFAAGFFLLARPLVRFLYPPEYADAVLPMLWMAAAILPMFLNGLFGYGVVAREKQTLMIRVYSTGVLFQLVAGRLLVPQYGAVGAAISYLAGETALLIFGLVATAKGITPLPPGALARPFLCAVAVGGALALFSRFPLVIAALAAAVAYGACLATLGVFSAPELRRIREVWGRTATVGEERGTK